MIYLVLELLKVGYGKEEDDEEYGGAAAGAGSVPTGSVKRTRDGDEERNEDGDDEQDPKKPKI